MKSNTELRRIARISLVGNWGISAVISLIVFLIVGLPPSILDAGLLVYLLVGIVVEYGYEVLFLQSVRKEKEVDFDGLIAGFKEYGRIFGTGVLRFLYTLLWTLLFVIPGIVKSYSYAMTNYVLKDEPDLRYDGAIEKSIKMMEGHKMQLFLLDLSFIGWYLLCILTLGIGFLFLSPYVLSAHAAFYESLKTENNAASVDGVKGTEAVE